MLKKINKVQKMNDMKICDSSSGHFQYGFNHLGSRVKANFGDKFLETILVTHLILKSIKIRQLSYLNGRTGSCFFRYLIMGHILKFTTNFLTPFF